MSIEHQKLTDTEAKTAWDQSGFMPEAESAFRAAAFLCGKKTLPLDKIRQALKEHDGDMVDAALFAFGLEVSSQNRQALVAVMSLDSFKKDETPHFLIEPGNLDADEAAEEVNRAFLTGAVQEVSLGGKHSKGTSVAKDTDSNHVYLLKPGSGKPSPASGVTQESASQSRRECAFWKVADEIGIGNFFPRADLLMINGSEVAAMRLLPFDFKTLAQLIKQDPNAAVRILEPYRRTGVMHKWALLDFICGNPDRHGGNVMANPDGEVGLIDHGSAFAGSQFDPAHDGNSFVPFYLRATVRGRNFNLMSFSEKLRVMPTVNAETNAALEEWLNHIDVDKVREILDNYEINAQPVLDRLDKAKAAVQATSFDSAINQLWIST